MGYKVPVVNQAEEAWEPYALDMLVSILDGGGSARFAKNLVRGEQIAVSAGAGYNPFTRLQGLLLIDGSPAPGFDMAQLEAALLKEIDKLKHEQVSQEELERITTQVVAAKVYERDSVFYQAMQLGILETVGLDWRLNDEVVDRLKAVTPEQVQAVAKKYLIEDNLTFARLDPQPMDEASAKRQMRAAAGGGHGR
jgi:zinc protease